MSYHPGSKTSGLRWREDTGIEKRCDSCPRGMQFWPLTEEFWSFRASFVKCRACYAKVKHASQRRRYAESEAKRRASLEYQRQYRSETGDSRRITRLLYYWADPELRRAKARERYQRNRDRILDQRKASYWARKEAA